MSFFPKACAVIGRLKDLPLARGESDIVKMGDCFVSLAQRTHGFLILCASSAPIRGSGGG
jgi:hypothetical protein